MGGLAGRRTPSADQTAAPTNTAMTTRRWVRAMRRILENAAFTPSSRRQPARKRSNPPGHDDAAGLLVEGVADWVFFSGVLVVAVFSLDEVALAAGFFVERLSVA